jgi:hypothetical protein
VVWDFEFGICFEFRNSDFERFGWGQTLQNTQNSAAFARKHRVGAASLHSGGPGCPSLYSLVLPAAQKRGLDDFGVRAGFGVAKLGEFSVSRVRNRGFIVV